MMQYITRPATLNAVESRLLAIIETEGNWLPDRKCLSYDDLEALEHLRYMGKIELAAFGGFKLKGTVAKSAPLTPAAVTSMLVAAGLPAHRILRVVPTSGAWKRPGNGVQFTVLLDKAGNVGQVDKRAFLQWIADGATLVIRVKE
jgi:hypothetical protein